MVPTDHDGGILSAILEAESPYRERVRIWQWTDIYKKTCEALKDKGIRWRRQVDPAERWLIIQSLWAGPSCSEALPPTARRPAMVKEFASSLRELLREEISWETYKNATGCKEPCEGGPCAKFDEVGAWLCWLLREYERYLQDRGLADSAQVATLTRELLLANSRSLAHIVRRYTWAFVGFMSFTHGQLELVRGLTKFDAHLRVFMPESGTGAYSAADQLEGITKKEANFAFPPKCIEISGATDRLAIETALKELLLWSLGKVTWGDEPFPGWENVGMLLPQDDLPTAKEALVRFQIPYQLKSGLPVAQTQFWSLVSRIFAAAKDNWPTRKTSFLLADRLLLGEGLPLSEATRKAPSGEGGWKAFLKDVPKGVEVFDALASFWKNISEGGLPEELLEALAKFIGERLEVLHKASDLAGEDIALDESVRMLASSCADAEKWALEHSASSEATDTANRALAGDHAIEFLRTWSEEAILLPPLQRKGVLNVYVDSPPVLAHHPAWVLVGVGSDRWPGKLRESPILPDEQRQIFHDRNLGLSPTHLPLLNERREQRRALFRRLLAAGDGVVFAVRPLADTEGRPIPPSPFFEEATGGETPWVSLACSVERPSSRALLSAREMRFSGVEAAADVPSRGRALPQAFPPARTKEAYLGDVNEWKGCPFRYAARRLWNIEEEAPSGFDPKLGGNLLHELWKRLWEERFRSGKALSDLVEALWEEVARSFYEEVLSRYSLYGRRLLYQVQRLARLQDSLESRLAPLRRDQMREYPLPELKINGVLFKGRADRIELLTDGSAVVLDYKSGGSDYYRDSVQLAAYAVALEEAGTSVAGYAYLCHKDGSIYGHFADLKLAKIFEQGRKKTSLKDKIDEARSTLESMANRMTSGLFSPDYSSKSCRDCGYKALCRREEIVRGGDNNE
ncbi:PD-(D/E)XK nuclease family protein [Acetomicrobium sp. S15 = DSM 107314]|uniref:PD-(D/E)XK nuclease family protein n=1 Tax=Acetomicrobium sp. S15 = DSM 107314 TaxID=2529858 RepID=UPI0018E168DB